MAAWVAWDEDEYNIYTGQIENYCEYENESLYIYIYIIYIYVCVVLSLSIYLDEYFPYTYFYRYDELVYAAYFLKYVL